MKNLKRKGFTIVELVIVIAVIAILSAVLIPTFGSLVKKANISADEQAVKQMNTALAIYTVENGKPEFISQVKNALDENEINIDGLIPVTKGYAFYWDPVENKIVLVGGEKQAESDWKILAGNEYGVVEKVEGEDALIDAITTFTKEGENVSGHVVLSNNVVIPSDAGTIHTSTDGKNYPNTFFLRTGDNLSVDLNDKELENAAFDIRNGSSLTIKNGTLDMSGLNDVLYARDSSLTLENVTIIVSGNKTSAVYVDGLSDVTIRNCKIVSEYYGYCTNSSAPEKDGTRVVIENTVIEASVPIMVSTNSNVTIKDCKLYGKDNAIVLHGGNINIENVEISTYVDSNQNLTVGQGGTAPAAGIVLMAHGSNWPHVGNYTLKNITVLDDSVSSTSKLLLYVGEDSDCLLTLNGKKYVRENGVDGLIWLEDIETIN